MGVPREHGLPPFTGDAPEVLILGSFPSKISLEQRRYYANPRNQFWSIMADLLTGEGAPRDVGSLSRVILDRRIALWDVIASRRFQAGSMDHMISDPEWNDIPRFLQEHPTIRFIGTNGRTAGGCFRRSAGGRSPGAGIRTAPLPSTSPAYASCSYEEKRAKWSIILGFLSGPEG